MISLATINSGSLLTPDSASDTGYSPPVAPAPQPAADPITYAPRILTTTAPQVPSPRVGSDSLGPFAGFGSTGTITRPSGSSGSGSSSGSSGGGGGGGGPSIGFGYTPPAPRLATLNAAPVPAAPVNAVAQLPTVTTWASNLQAHWHWIAAAALAVALIVAYRRWQ